MQKTATMAAMSTAPVRAALLGYGGSARRIHRPLLTATDGIELVAAIPTSDRARESLADTAPGVRPVSRVADLASEGVELVVVATPDVAHRDGAQEALEAGFGVVVEKPLAATVEDAQELVRLAQPSGLFLASFQNRRWDSDFLTVRRLLNADVLGAVIRFESRISRWSPTVGGTWRDKRRHGTLDGRLGDLGAHLVDQAYALFGPVSRVYGEVETQRPGAVANDDVFLALQHESGVISHLHMTAVSAARLPRMRVQGLAGAYVKYGFDPQQEQLYSGETPGAPGWGVEPTSEEGVLAGSDGESRVPTEPGDWREFYRAVVRSLRHGSPFPVRPEESVEVLRILRAGAQSAADGRLVDPATV